MEGTFMENAAPKKVRVSLSSDNGQITRGLKIANDLISSEERNAPSARV